MKKILLPVILVGLILLTACSTALPMGESELSPAPQFVVEDLQGNHVDVAAGQALVLNFWASWCPSCRRMMPAWQTIYDELGGDVRMMSINVGESRDRAMQFTSGAGHTFPVYLDAPLASAADAFALTHFPTTIFINAHGDVLHRHIGTLNATMLRLHTADLLD
ncbi:MAG: TlpA family protein disulfide reductase [Oscillospiraceae bacterium]|nr:TlpA family protein disulfide reductase [Oscillospiraceae bacterium]